MNPFVLNKMHGAFVPDRLTDIAATTPAVSPESTTESHALRISELSDHLHPSGVGINRLTMAVNCAQQERFVVSHDGPITTDAKDLLTLIVEAGIQVTIDPCAGLVEIPASWKSTK
jgi:hypothetical protein